MDKSKISTAALEKALKSLERAIVQPKNEFNRDSVIQRFEFTFELSWKVLQKVLSADKPLEDSSVKGILREAAKVGLIPKLNQWLKFQEARNITSHTYNEDTAEEVYGVAIELPKEAQSLLKAIQKSLAKK